MEEGAGSSYAMIEPMPDAWLNCHNIFGMKITNRIC
jgi:hypothetical protein